MKPKREKDNPRKQSKRNQNAEYIEIESTSKGASSEKAEITSPGNSKERKRRALTIDSKRSEEKQTEGLTPDNGAQDSTIKGATSIPLEGKELSEETSSLREKAHGLAMKAGTSLEKKDEWSTKDFDTFVNTWIKIIGVQIKLDGDADEIEKLIGEFTTDGDEYPDAL